MGSIPVLQERFIPQVSTKVSDAPVISSAVNLATAVMQEGLRYKQARDTSKVNEQYSKFQTEIQTEYDSLKVNVDNPENFTPQWNDYYDKKKKEYLSNSELSGSAKRTLENVINRYQANNADTVIRTQRQLQVDAYANNIESTAVNNNMLAYRAGQNLDLNSLQESQKIIDSNIIAGSTIVSRDKLEKSRRTQTQNVYSNFIKGTVETDLNYAKQLVENKEIQDKLVDLKTINGLRDYIRRVEREQETREKDLKKAALNVDTQTSLQSEFENFDIGLKEGRDIIKNVEVDNIDNLIGFRDQVKGAYERGQVTDAQYRNWMAKTTSVFTNKIREDELEYGGIPVFTSVNEQLTKDLNVQLKDNSKVDDTEFVGIYEDTVSQLKSGEYNDSVVKEITGNETAKAVPINLNSINKESKLIAQKLLQLNTEKYNQLKSGRSDAQTMIVGNQITPLNSRAKNTGQPLDNGGWKVERQNGQLFDVRRDSNGKVLEWRAR